MIKREHILSENFVIGIGVSLTLLYWIILAFHILVLTSLPGWFWGFISKPFGPIWLIASMFSISIITVYLVLKIKNRYCVKLVLLFLLGVSLQFGFAFLEGRGMAALQDRMVYTGHAEFAKIAVQQKDIYYTLSNYEKLLNSGELGEYANSKPPGTLMLYMLTFKIADSFSHKENDGENIKQLIVVSSFVWPLLTYLVLFPLFYFVALLFGKETGMLTCTLYVFVPSVNLVTLHTDQVFFPFLFMMSLLLSGIAYKRNNMLIAFFAGVSIYFSIWCSFALAFVVPFVVVLCFIWNKQQGVKLKKWWAFKLLLMAGLGILLSDIAARIIFNYDIVARYENAFRYHLAWKNWNPSYVHTIYFALLNLLEFTVWVGIPIATLAYVSLDKSLAEYFNCRRITMESSQPLVFFGILLFMAFFGKTKGEVARLWLFLVPYICMLAAYTISKKVGKDKSLLMWIVVLLQWGTVYMMKVNQDFY